MSPSRVYRVRPVRQSISRSAHDAPDDPRRSVIRIRFPRAFLVVDSIRYFTLGSEAIRNHLVPDGAFADGRDVVGADLEGAGGVLRDAVADAEPP